MAVSKMSVQKWIEVPDNPRQRDTEDRMSRWLRTRSSRYCEPHCDVVAAAIDGQLVCKIDGHTRAGLWEAGKLDLPPGSKVSVMVKTVRDLHHAAELYDLYDSPFAVETVTDRVFGACREHGITLRSTLLRKHRFALALKFAQNAGNSWKRIDVGPLVAYWKPELMMVDSWSLSSGLGPLITMALWASCLDGNKANDFFRGVLGDGGEKANGEMDGVAALAAHLDVRRAQQLMNGGENIRDLLRRGYNAYTHWKNKESIRVRTGLRGMDIDNIPEMCFAKKGHLLCQ